MDKTITDRDKKKEMYNPYIEYRIFYSFIIYLFSLIGLILFLNKLKVNRYKLDKIDKYLILNLMLIFYFIFMGGPYGNSRYLVPALLSFFVARII